LFFGRNEENGLAANQQARRIFWRCRRKQKSHFRPLLAIERMDEAAIGSTNT
jgi:hypothetical protein